MAHGHELHGLEDCRGPSATTTIPRTQVIDPFILTYFCIFFHFIVKNEGVRDTGQLEIWVEEEVGEQGQELSEQTIQTFALQHHPVKRGRRGESFT